LLRAEQHVGCKLNTGMWTFDAPLMQAPGVREKRGAGAACLSPACST